MICCIQAPQSFRKSFSTFVYNKLHEREKKTFSEEFAKLNSEKNSLGTFLFCLNVVFMSKGIKDKWARKPSKVDLCHFITN